MSDLNERAGKALMGRWRAGMVVLWQQDAETPWPERINGPGDVTDPPPAGATPIYDVPRAVGVDMSDPATRGAYLDVVREAWGEFGGEAFVRQLVGGTVRSPCWVCQTRDRSGWNAYEGASEAECIAAALEAANAGTPDRR
jgi:hypothetical protein